MNKRTLAVACLAFSSYAKRTQISRMVRILPTKFEPKSQPLSQGSHSLRALSGLLLSRSNGGGRVGFARQTSGAAGTRQGKQPPARMSSSGPEVATLDANPLLDTSGLPRFDSIEPTHVEPAVLSVLASLREDFKRTEAEFAELPSSYEAVLEPLEKMKFPMEYSWSVVSHLNNVKNSDELREAHQKCEPEMVKIGMEMGQSRPLYEMLAKLESQDLSGAQRRVIEASLRDMKHSGVDLDGDAKEEFNEIALKLADLSTKFQNNLLDSTKAFELIVTDSSDLEGLPDSAREAAAQSYAQAHPDDTPPNPDAGPWRLTLDMPSYIPAMKYLKSSKLREQLYRAFITRASEGAHDNGPILTETLKLKTRAAQLLGFNNYAEQSLASKMAGSVEAVDNLTMQLFEKARPAAERELAELQEFAALKGYEGDLRLWDVTYWAERLKEDRYDYDEEALRPYFSLPKVLDGMFRVAGKLFGIEIRRNDSGAERWHPDVMYFEVYDQSSQAQLASFYLDPYARPGEKRGGAWMAGCIGRSKALNKKPVAYLTCNGSPPVGDKPSLMTFSDAETLFHEFGHGLQHMLTHVDEGDCAGINNIEWDAVELPSQFMENWLFHKPTVDSFAVHFETGEPLPPDVFEKIKGARTFMAGSMILRQLQFGALDMELHAHYQPKPEDTAKEPFSIQRRISNKFSVLPPLPEDAFLCAFAHIFAGGYAAGYYSYMWALVLSADAFAAFEDAGLDDDEALATVGRRFRKTVLGSGGSCHPADVYRSFRGRDATVDALLRHQGLL